MSDWRKRRSDGRPADFVIGVILCWCGSSDVAGKEEVMFTVKTLIEVLQLYDPDSIVILSSDPEGNAYDTLYAVDERAWIPEWKEVYFRELTDDMKAEGYTEEDVRADGQPAVVLWP